ncbi:TPA: baseplate J/gp47 family protein [Pseudomonas aeruginosa]|uniref:baseplate assembly protein n=1 Tax=Pseudomonas aeruginosa TaxID=287 RepID=UPI00053CFA63|nr:baseplate J/gp47 family protein [Pseudomonas aeruginosa]
MRDLPPPELVKIDPAGIEADLIARYEAKSGKALYPAQIERLFIDQIAYAQSLVLSSIQHAGEQLLVRTSSAPTLDYLGELVGTARLLAQPARCRMLFSVPAPVAVPMLIQAGTRVGTSDARLVFRTDQDVTIATGQAQVRVTATCETTGTAGNGWAVGQIATLVSLPADGLAARNETVTADGADEESDERYRERIILAPEAYTNAGSRGAYRYHALAVHQSIIDVAVHGPEEGQLPGHVALYPLTSAGMPTADLLQRVESLVSGEKVRPLCDTVHVLVPSEVKYTIRAALTFYAGADRVTAMATAQAAAEAYAADRRAGLGRDIVPEQLVAVLQAPGVYRADVTEPAALRVLSGNEWANCSSILLTDAGIADD